MTTRSGHALTFRGGALVGLRHPAGEHGRCAAVNPRRVLRLNPQPRVEDGFPEVIGRLRGGELRYQRGGKYPGPYFHKIETDALDVAVPRGATLRTKAGTFRIGEGSVLLTDRVDQANPRRRRRVVRPAGVFTCRARSCPSRVWGPHGHLRVAPTRQNPLSIRRTTHRGRTGFAIVGRDPSGRRTSIFTDRLGTARHIKRKVARGEQTTVADFMRLR